MEEDEGEEEDEDEGSEAAGSEAEDATPSNKEDEVKEKVVEPTTSTEKAAAPEEKSILEFSVDDMADALSKMSVVKDSA